jgi:hypothetical protein
MNSIATVHARARGRWALIAAGVFALLGSFAVTAPAQAGYYEGYGYNPCSYRCGYPRYYPIYHHRCCGSHVVYERRYVEYYERRVVSGGHRCCGYRRPYGYYGAYRPYGYGYGSGYGYGYGGIGRHWPLPFDGYGPYPGPYAGVGYDEPRPPAPVPYDGDE